MNILLHQADELAKLAADIEHSHLDLQKLAYMLLLNSR
jgi:light-regulated signal transduction histidine kinase (bacteriophytochrome)